MTVEKEKVWEMSVAATLSRFFDWVLNKTFAVFSVTSDKSMKLTVLKLQALCAPDWVSCIVVRQTKTEGSLTISVDEGRKAARFITMADVTQTWEQSVFWVICVNI